MEATTYSNFRKSLKFYMKQVNVNAEPLIVTNKDSDDNVVVIGKNDYDSLMETMHIMEDKALYAKIKRGQHQLSGKTNYHELIEVSEDEEELV